MAAGGRLWVETSLSMRHTGGHVSSGYDRMNAAKSMVSETEESYCPGGFKRDLRFRVIEIQELKRYIRNDPKFWTIVVNRMLVEVI